MVENDHEEAVRVRFLKEIEGYRMETVRADGVHRHLSFRRADGVGSGFDVVTWPWHLCISGEMGTFVFSRLHDMFEFFRGPYINPSYWAEKLVSDSPLSGHRVFSPDLHREAVERQFKRWTFDSDAERMQAWEEIADSWTGILDAGSRDEAVGKASEWECPVSGQRFTDFWEADVEEFSPQFLWCCHAARHAAVRHGEAARAAAA